MGTKTTLGLIVAGTAAIVLSSVIITEQDKVLVIAKQPITAVVINDSMRICQPHGGIDKLQRMDKDIYNLQCKDGAWFLNLKLANIAADKPKVTLKEIM